MDDGTEVCPNVIFGICKKLIELSQNQARGSDDGG
jgi:hypothetical protein